MGWNISIKRKLMCVMWEAFPAFLSERHSKTESLSLLKFQRRKEHKEDRFLYDFRAKVSVHGTYLKLS